MSLREDLHDSLKAVFDQFDDFCRANSCFYNIVSDEQDTQGYVVSDRDQVQNLHDYLQPVLTDKKVHLDVDENRPDGVLFTFTLSTIQDQHWRVLSKKPKRHEYSLFTSEKDAKKVRSGKALGQRGFMKRLSETLATFLDEDQYKQPSGKHRRSQSMFRSSFGRSRSFGGVTNGGIKEQQAVAGGMIPPKLERPSNVGLVSADKSTALPGKGKKPKSPRKDLTDIPVKPPTHLQNLLCRLDERLSYTDQNERSLITNKRVPDAKHQPANPVVPDAVVVTQVLDPSGGMLDPEMAKQQNFKPLGTTTPPTCSTVSAAPAASNVRVRNVRDYYGPEIATQKSLGWDAKPQLDQRIRKALKKLEVGKKEEEEPEEVKEDIGRPEDGYDLLQQLVKGLGLPTQARKVIMSGREYAKIDDGELCLEFDDVCPRERSGKLVVYRDGNKIMEYEVDLRRDFIVDEVLQKLADVL